MKNLWMKRGIAVMVLWLPCLSGWAYIMHICFIYNTYMYGK